MTGSATARRRALPAKVVEGIEETHRAAPNPAP